MYTGTLKATELGMSGPAGQSIALSVGNDGQARRPGAMPSAVHSKATRAPAPASSGSVCMTPPKPPGRAPSWAVTGPQVAPVKCSVSISGLRLRPLSRLASQALAPHLRAFGLLGGPSDCQGPGLGLRAGRAPCRRGQWAGSLALAVFPRTRRRATTPSRRVG